MVGTATLGLADPARFRLADPRIAEASGIAPGLVSPGVVYVQNDSGDVNRFFALDAGTGATAATVTVRGAHNVDWEDLAVAPDAAGVASVWLADIGDNRADRAEVRIYRVPEPHIAARDRGRAISTAPAAVWRLRYPGGPVDAEGLAVTPAGRAYIVTKSLAGSTVYLVPPRPDASRLQMLHAVGRVTFPLVTGAAISRDGAVLAVRTYTDAYVWRLGPGGVPAALASAPTRVDLPAQPQGEGIAVGGGSLLVDSEGVHSAVYSVPLPVLTGPTRPAAPTSPTPSAASGSATSASPQAGRMWSVGVVAVVLVMLAGLAGWHVRRRRSR